MMLDTRLVHAKPCPFCKSGPEHLRILFRHKVVCNRCGATGPKASVFANEDRSAAAVELWNLRADLADVKLTEGSVLLGGGAI